jgi:MFS family permease
MTIPEKRRTLIRGLIRLIFYLSLVFSSALVTFWVFLFLMELAKRKEVGNWHFLFLALLATGVTIIFITDRISDKLEEKRKNHCIP